MMISIRLNRLCREILDRQCEGKNNQENMETMVIQKQIEMCHIMRKVLEEKITLMIGGDHLTVPHQHIRIAAILVLHSKEIHHHHLDLIDFCVNIEI